MAIEQYLDILSLIKTIIILISAFIITKFFGRIIFESLEKAGKSRKIIIPLNRVLSFLVYFIAIMLILLVYEVDITAAVAGLGIGAIILGFGLQDLISNWISGIIIVAERIYHIDDVIKVGNITGVVRDITLRSTRLKTYDRNEVIIPNSYLINEKVINLTGGKNETVTSVIFYIDYTCDTEKAKKTIENVLRKNQKVIINENKKREIRFIVRSKEWTTEVEALFWINDPKNEEFIKSEITEEIKKQFEKNKILPPIPAFLRSDYIKK